MRRAAIFLLALAWLAALPPALRADGLWWRVTAPGGATAYVLGSIHVARAGLYPLGEDLMAAFGQAGRLVVEMDTLALPPDTVAACLKEHGLAGDRPRPWLRALTLQSQALHDLGYDETLGLDRFFLAEAKKRGLPVVELETLEDQMAPLWDMTAAQEGDFLASAQGEIPELPRLAGAMFRAWRAGDAEGFRRVFFEKYGEWPRLAPVLDKIVFRRSRAMAARLEALAADGAPAFVVVGAGHLVGPGSVLDILARRGFAIEQM